MRAGKGVKPEQDPVAMMVRAAAVVKSERSCSWGLAVATEPVENETGVNDKGVDPKNPFIKIGLEASLEVMNTR